MRVHASSAAAVAPPFASSIASPKARGGPTEVASRRTPLSVDQIRSAVSAGYARAYGKPAPDGVVDILSAQVATETAYGQHMVAFNFGGIKGASPEGLTTRCKTHEVLGGHDKTIVDGFRAYSSADNGAADYVSLLQKRFPNAMAAAERGDVDGFAHSLKASGYYTADASEYARAIRGAMASPPSDSAPGLTSLTPTLLDSRVAVDGPANALPASDDISRVLDALSRSALSTSPFQAVDAGDASDADVSDSDAPPIAISAP